MSTPVRDALAILIGEDLNRSIAALGYPVGMGLAPSEEATLRAAERIIDRIKDKSLELLAERVAPSSAKTGGPEGPGMNTSNPLPVKPRTAP